MPIDAAVGNAAAPVLPRYSNVEKVDPLIEPERLEQQPMMGAADLMAERLLNVAGLPLQFFEKRGKGRLRRRHALAHQRFGIGGHENDGWTSPPSPPACSGAIRRARLGKVRNARWPSA